MLDPVIFHSTAEDTWFEADLPRIYANMTDRQSNHYRTKVHPLFSLAGYLPVYPIKKVFHVEPIVAVRGVSSIIAGVWAVTLFAVLRLFGCRRFDAALFTSLAAVSASAIFFLTIPETYAFGSLTILLALGTVLMMQERSLPSLWYVVMSALTLGMTVTNWMAGIFATFASHPWRKSFQITVNALCLVTVLWGAEKFIFPSAQFFIGDQEERLYINPPESGGPLSSAKSFLFHTMVMPEIKVVGNTPEWPKMITQKSSPGSGTRLGTAAAGLWVALVVLGIWALFRIAPHRPARVVLGLILFGQFVLHLAYGGETFLYSLHFAPLLVILAGLGTQTSARPAVLLLAGGLAVAAAVNNYSQFSKAVSFYPSNGSPREQVRNMMRVRPQDPWPRGVGHVILARPGDPEEGKSYHEPGGNFSPTVGSFGVSLWVLGADGTVTAASEKIPLRDVRQRFFWTTADAMPDIATDTPYYRTSWSVDGGGRWTLRLKSVEGNTNRLMVVVRSVGPAGGPIRRLRSDGTKVLINDRWSVTVHPAPSDIYLGEEGGKNWISDRTPGSEWTGESGWGYARIELGKTNEWIVTIEDPNWKPTNEWEDARGSSTLKLDLPDERFIVCLNSQLAHLLMGLVDRQTRPGDPMNYPLPWQRDGAYVVAALARSGRVQVAKELSVHLADNDFFGGFGTEADAPGLGIWALEEVAVRLDQPEYDRWIWPHIQRKVRLIQEMIATDHPLYKPFIGPIVPIYEKNREKRLELTLLCKPSREGLIIGKMDWQFPVLYVNAVSYRGLRDAAKIADRLNYRAEAKRWRTEAALLKKAWEKGFNSSESGNQRSSICGLWPTWVSSSISATYQKNLEGRWAAMRDDDGGFREKPLWTYFDIAESHQWLFLGRPDRVWATLEWFWNHQTSPGLFTFSEGESEENSFNRWERVRGWVNPPDVTPHYWTAAEMAMLQLDMLAYLDESAGEPTVVIGGGIPRNWLDRPMAVRGLHLGVVILDWTWDGKEVRVTLNGGNAKVRLGSVFPPDSRLIILE